MQSNRSRQRKLYCALVIVGLFFLMLLHRPQVQASAQEANVQVLNLGEVDLGGSISRFVLTSFRGPLICGLWWEAREAQARHEYEQMQLVIRALTKLQPHFKRPWQFEAWNLAYNVAVEFDAISDKYFFVTEGIGWLVEGERVNRANLYDPSSARTRRINDPDMTAEIGETIQNKFSHSDEHEIYRILIQLSCIPPERRDLNQLRNNPQALATFMSTYPQLVRKIGEFRFVPEGSQDALAREILALLELYKEIPGLHATPAEVSLGLSQPRNPFPFWPQEDSGRWGRPANPALEANQDSFDIARHWFEYSLEPLPATTQELRNDELSMSQKLSRDTRMKNSLVFRANAPRARSLQAQQLVKEGWAEPARLAWELAYQRWRRYGVQNSLDLPEAELAQLRAQAHEYEYRFPNLAKDLKPPPEYLKAKALEEYRRVSDSMAAYSKMKKLEAQQKVSHYGYWSVAAETYRTEASRDARQLWHDANRRRSDPREAMDLFDESMRRWRPLLQTVTSVPVEMDIGQRFAFLVSPGLPAAWTLAQLSQPAPTRFGADAQIQETLIQLNDQYLQVESCLMAPRVLRSGIVASEAAALLGKQLMGGGCQLGMVGTMPLGITPWRIEDAEEVVQVSPGPFDPYVTQEVKDIHATRDRVRRREALENFPAMGLPEAKPASPAPAGQLPRPQ